MNNTPADLAVLLLDDPHAQRSRRANAHFEQTHTFVEQSIIAPPEKQSILEPSPAVAIPTASPEQTFSLATRLGKDHFDDQLRAEALVSAIKKLRQRPLPSHGSGRVIKSS
jgi:hypothetical protein